jgi:hypothetical protein
VRIHTGDLASASAKSVGASAYTVGSHVAFARGAYAPGTEPGRRLLAHELTHVVQQQGSPSTGDLTLDDQSGALETEARASATHLTAPSGPSASPISPRQAARVIARGFWGEAWDAVTGVGPIDARRAKNLASKSLAAAERTGLPGIRNGPADAWRHCYWNCTMTAAIGADQAKTIADNHEKHGGGPANENAMDFHNNAEGRLCGGKDCDVCCQNDLDGGLLRLIDPTTGAIVPSTPTPRGTAPAKGAVGYYNYYNYKYY